MIKLFDAGLGSTVTLQPNEKVYQVQQNPQGSLFIKALPAGRVKRDESIYTDKWEARQEIKDWERRQRDAEAPLYDDPGPSDARYLAAQESGLRNQLVRLAYQKSALRPHILRILSEK